MSDGQGQPWGMCAAFGCPLLGTLGSGGEWWCFCHHNRPHGANDAITAKLRSDALMPIVESMLDMRRCGCSFFAFPEVYRSIQARLIAADRRDLLLGEADCSPFRPGKPIVRQWLARLERELIIATQEIGSQRELMPSTTPTAPVIGPTHAMQHYSETER